VSFNEAPICCNGLLGSYKQHAVQRAKAMMKIVASWQTAGYMIDCGGEMVHDGVRS
jgi:hypothetical protein